MGSFTNGGSTRKVEQYIERREGQLDRRPSRAA